MTSLPAVDLRLLCGIQRRSASSGQARSKDIGIQRRHEVERSEEISRFISAGFPWSDLTASQKDDASFSNLRKPGWLPTALVVNVLTAEDERYGLRVSAADRIDLVDDGEVAHMLLPESFSGSSWKAGSLAPIEIIDGQHRLWAVDSGTVPKDFDLPVVVFVGLDISWQAYLFWTINIKPRRINASLAFDLYPLLRTEDWLQRFRGPTVYRETRAQELTEALWIHPSSPWHDRINMLGEPGQVGVTQAAWIRSLVATFIKSSEGQRVSIGGLFGAPVGRDDLALPWSGSQQAAFLIELWRLLAVAVENSEAQWAQALRKQSPDFDGDAAFFGPNSLLNSDPGVRGVLYLANDLTVLRFDELALFEWRDSVRDGNSDETAITKALRELRRLRVGRHLSSLAKALASFDWRSSTGAGLEPQERILRLVYRGSGGYREIRRQLLAHVSSSEDRAVSKAALAAAGKLGLAEP